MKEPAQTEREQELRHRIVGRFLKESREDAGLTQQEVATRLSYSTPQYISNWERGVSLPPLDQLPRLSRMFSVPPGRIIEVLHAYQDEHLKLQKRQLAEVFRDQPALARLPRARA